MKPITKICLGCQKPFRDNSKGKKKIYCSLECRHEFYQQRRFVSKTEKNQYKDFVMFGIEPSVWRSNLKLKNFL
jgi:hypothetical protein